MSAISITGGSVRIDAGAPASRAPEAAATVRPPPATGAPPPTPAPAVSPEVVDQALESLRKAVEPVAQNLQFLIDDDTGRTVVKVVDSNTQELIRQIPAEEVLAITRALDRLQGLLLKQKA